MEEKMDVLFVFSNKNSINPGKPLKVQMYIQIGISAIASLLRSYGHNVDLFVLCRKTGKQFINEYIKGFNPRLICFTAVFSEYDFISGIAGYIKNRYPDIYLLAGGAHVTLNPGEAIKDAFDAICLGEGEFPTLELVEQLEAGKKPSRIKNLWIKDGKTIQRNPTRDFIRDLDNMPFPNRDIWQNWVEYPGSPHTILLGRGCPFRCTYCCNHALRKISGGTYVRLRSPGNVLIELKDLISKYPQPKTVYFEIETIGINNKFALELCSILEQFNRELGEPLSFGMNLRITPEADYNSLFQAMKKANFGSINIGLESGSEKIRKEILQRNYSNVDYLRTVKLAKNYGLKVKTYVLIGIPGETLSDFKETIKIVRQSQPDDVYYSIFFPYPGTDLYRHCKDSDQLSKRGRRPHCVGRRRRHFVPSRRSTTSEEKKFVFSANSYKVSVKRVDTRTERHRALLDLPGFSKRQIQRQFNWFYYNIYKGHRSLNNIRKRTKYEKLESSYILSAINKNIILIFSLLHKIKNIVSPGRIRRR